MTEAERVERVAISMAEFDLGHGIWPTLSEFERGAWLFKAGSVISTYLAMLATEAGEKKALEQQRNSSGLVPVSPGVYAPVPDDEPPLGHKEGDIITYVMENGNGRILHVERPTGTVAKAGVWKALRAFYRWYDLDGSVGGAANVFEDHREAVMAYLHANLPDKEQSSPGYTQYTGFRP